jgi:eukaryotic-like serine/threonine-protein kinase
LRRQTGLPKERWDEVMALLESALERAPGERPQFLDQACGSDTALREEIETLLAAAAAAEGFLEPPVVREGEPRRSGAILVQRLEAALGTTYRFERELGGAGMSRLFVAAGTGSDRRVVLKLLPPELATAVGVARFRREVQLAARLRHSHLVPLLTAGEIEGGILYYTMPYVEGESLRDRLQRETMLPVDEALRIARQVANALSYAHDQGVIHRDIKPENILLSGGQAVVTDFGIALALQADPEVRLTHTGDTLGTPAYMSPEQVAGEEMDGRADVYSLGCVLYEMLTGQPPFRGPALLAVLSRDHVDAPQRLGALREQVPETVEHAVMKAIAQMPAERFNSATEFAAALSS